MTATRLIKISAPNVYERKSDELRGASSRRKVYFSFIILTLFLLLTKYNVVRNAELPHYVCSTEETFFLDFIKILK